MMFNNYHGMWNFWIFGLILLLILAIYVASDAMRFGENGLLWALVVFFMPMMGIFIYLVVRSTWNKPNQIDKRVTQTQWQAEASPPTREMVYQTTPRVDDPDYGKKNSEGTQYCTACGFKNDLSASYCNSCGARILSGDA